MLIVKKYFNLNIVVNGHFIFIFWDKGCGMIGRIDKLNRITGLDPANLLFEEPGDRLSKDDA